MTRTEAFRQLIEKDQWYLPLGITPQTAATHKKRFLENGNVSYKFITRALIAAGYTLKQEEIWDKNQ